MPFSSTFNQIRIRYRDEHGNWKEKAQTFHGGIKEAKKIERQMERDKEQGKIKSGKPITLNMFVDEHYLPAVVDNLSQRTLRGYQDNFGLIDRNPTDAAERPRIERYSSRCLSADEAKELIDAAKGTRLLAPVTLAVSLGLRRGEVLGLTWNHIGMETGRLQVLQTLQRASGQGLVVQATKTHRSSRTLEMPAFTRDLLREWKRQQATERLAAGPAWDSEGKWPDWVCTQTNGHPLSPEQLNGDFAELLITASLPAIRFHDLRHSTATLLLEQGTHMKWVSELLGHSQIGITMDTYSHVTPGISKEVASKLDAIFIR
jgi:integrase